MPLGIARQFHFDHAVMLLGRDHHIRILLAFFPLAETRGRNSPAHQARIINTRPARLPGGC
jgi:hypothetical protein